MRITEVIPVNEQLDEITARGVGQGIGNVAGSVVRGTKDFFSGIKQGYQQGSAGTSTASTATTTGGTTAAPAATSGATAAPAATSGATAAPAATGGATAAPAATVTVGQINKVIPTLRTRDLQSLKKTVDATIAKKSGTASSGSASGTTPAATGGAMGQMARNLSTTGPSSTGGQTTATPTGLVHRAKGTPTPESKLIGFKSKFLDQEI